jgi:TonB family protein
MISRLLIPTLLALPLCAQAPAVRILLQADKPPIGTPPLDTAVIADRLKAFAKDEGFVPPAQDGDGWILGIELTTQEEPNGLLVGGGAIRLSRVRGGKIIPDDVKETGALVVAWKSENLSSGLGDELVSRGRELLAEAKVVSGKPVPHPISHPQQEPKQENPAQPHRFDFSQVRIRRQPPQAPYPAEAKKNRVQGTVIVDVVVSPDGLPVSVAAVEGPGPLLRYACEWALRWRFEPLTMNGHPEYGRFKILLNFRLQ